MQSGRTVAGVENLGFLMDDNRTDPNDGESCERTSSLGRLAERHWRKPPPPEEAKDGTGTKQQTVSRSAMRVEIAIFAGLTYVLHGHGGAYYALAVSSFRLLYN